MKRNYKVDSWLEMRSEREGQMVHCVLTRNGKFVTECHSLRMARKIAKALDALVVQRRSSTVEERI